MASNTSKLAQEVIDYSKQIARLRVELAKLKKGTVEYELAERKLIQTEKSAKTAKENLISSTNKLNATNKRHKKSIDDSRGALTKYNATTKNTTSGLASMAGGFLKTIATVGKFFLAYQALNLVISAFRELVIGSVKTFVKFEDTLGKVQAVTSSTAEDMNNISEAIKTTAVETRFTATEIADLAVSLGKLGATSEEIPELLRPIATAAQAVGGDIATVGEAILKTNNQFGIASKDTAVTAAIFADAINTSALSLSSLGTALQYVGPLASQVGLTLADTSAFMKVLADNGFTASKIGTGLRNIFIKIKESGKPLIETLEELADKNISLADSVELVGIRSAGQFTVLLDNIDILKESVSVTNALTQARVAEAAQMKTTAAQADVLKAVYENLQLTVGTAIADNEVLLKGIGLLDKNSEILLRTQISLNDMFSKTDGIEKYKKALDEVVNESVKPATVAFKLLSEAGVGSSDNLEEAYKRLSKTMKITKEGAKNLLFELGKSSDSSKELKEKLRALFLEVGLSTDRANGQARLYLKTFEDLKIAIGIFDSVTEKIDDDAAATIKNNKQKEIRNELDKKYAGERKKIDDQEVKGILQAKEREKLSKDVEKDQDKEKIRLKKLEDARDRINNKLEEGLRLDEKTRKNLQDELEATEAQIELQDYRVNAYNIELKKANEVNSEFEKAFKDRKDNQIFLTKQSVEGFDDDIKNIQRRIKLSKEEYNKSVKNAEALFVLETKGKDDAKVTSEARIKLDKAVADARQKQESEVVNLIQEVKDATNEAGSARQKFLDEANSQGYGEEQVRTINSLFDKFGDNIDLVRLALEDLGLTLNEAMDDDSGLEKAENTVKDITISTSLYKQKLSDLRKELKNNIITTTEFSKAQEELKDEQIASLEAVLKQVDGTTEAGKAVQKIIKKQIDSVKKSVKGVESLGDQIKEIFKETFVDAARTALDAIDNFNKVSFDNTINSLNAQKDAVSERSSFEEDVLKAQLESQLISQEEYSSRLEQIKKNEVQRLNAIDKSIFDQENKRDRQKATSDYLLSLASIIPNLIVKDKQGNPVKISIMAAISGALATVAYGSQISAINKRQFIPRTFAEGGVVEGPSHEEGGVPFTVRGRSGYEMEGGEYIINKKSALKYKGLLDEINDTKKSPKYKFATGGVVGRIDNNENKKVELLEAIAEATTGTAINTGKPVKAFVSSSELNNDTNARRIKERNSNI